MLERIDWKLEETKFCTLGNHEVPKSDFGKKAKSKDGLGSWCKPCKRIYQNRWTKDNPRKDRTLGTEEHQKYLEYMKDYNKQYREDNKEALKISKKEYAQKNWEQEYARVRQWYVDNPDRVRELHRSARHRRRARIIGNGSEPYDSLEVFERDEWVCQLCLKPVDKTLVYPNQSSASIDHIVPISKGGPDTEINVQLAHWICNTRKGNRVENKNEI